MLGTLVRSSCLTLQLTFSARLQVKLIMPESCTASPSISCRLGLQSTYNNNNDHDRNSKSQSHSFVFTAQASLSHVKVTLTPSSAGQASLFLCCSVGPLGRPASPALPPGNVNHPHSN